jgi:hypothetical protein
MKKIVVLLVAALCTAAFVAPAFAALKPYASVRVFTYYMVTDNPTTANNKDLNITMDTSRFGVKGKKGAIKGKFELGTKGLSKSNTLGLRKLYGVYDFGAGTLLIGQNSHVADHGMDAVAKPDLNGFGLMGFDKTIQMTVRMDNGLYGSVLYNTKTGDDKTKAEFPFVAAGYNGEMGDTAVGAGVGYGSYDNGTNDIETYYVYGQVEQGVGAGTIAARIYYAQNLGAIEGCGLPAGANVVAGEDGETWAGYVTGSFKVSDKAKLQAGVGYSTTDNDGAGTESDDQYVVFVQAPIKVAKGFKITPNITYADYKENAAGVDEKSTLWIGAQWRMDF